MKVQLVSQAYTRSQCGLGIGCKFVDSLSNNQLSDIPFIDFVVHCAIKLCQGLQPYSEVVKALRFIFFLIFENKAKQVILCRNTVVCSFYIICPGTD